MRWKYKAYDQSGKVNKGVLDDVYTLQEVEDTLKKKKLLLKNARVLYSFSGSFVLKPAHLAVFFNNLADMVEGGISLRESLEVELEETKAVKMKKILKRLLDALGKGKPVYQSFADCGLVLGRTVLALLEVNEKSGKLASAFLNIGQMFEERNRIQNKIKNALIYPSLVFVSFIMVFIVYVSFVLPRFASLYSSSSGKPGALFKSLLAIGQLFNSSPHFVFGGFFILIAAVLFIYKKFPGFKEGMMSMLFRLPILSRIRRSGVQYDFYLLLYHNMESGLSLSKSLVLLKESDFFLPRERVVINRIFSALQTGEAFHEAIAGSCFSDARIRAILRSSGGGKDLLKPLDRINKNLAQEYQNRLENGLSFLPPLMVLLVGVIIGVLVVVIVYPLLSSSSMFVG